MLALLLVLLAAEPQTRPFTSPRSPAAEFGHGLTDEQAHEGWLALFDGQTAFGWRDGKVEAGSLTAGHTSTSFANCEVVGEATAAGALQLGEATVELPVGKFQARLVVDAPHTLRLAKGATVKTLLLKPSGLRPVFNGRDLTGWKVLKRANLADERQTRWSVVDGVLRGVGGPGAVELAGRFGDLVLQVQARTRGKLVNGGVFFRSVPGDFMNGYEAQLFNGCYDEDPGQPARYSTGAVDDRQLARRLVSRDESPLTMTVVAVGPHIATWVNGWQMTDWTDDREPDANPRVGRRLEPGTIQLQAHDAETDIEFRQVLVATVHDKQE
jgi:hypothetical protein